MPWPATATTLRKGLRNETLDTDVLRYGPQRSDIAVGTHRHEDVDIEDRYLLDCPAKHINRSIGERAQREKDHRSLPIHQPGWEQTKWFAPGHRMDGHSPRRPFDAFGLQGAGDLVHVAAREHRGSRRPGVLCVSTGAADDAVADNTSADAVLCARCYDGLKYESLAATAGDTYLTGLARALVRGAKWIFASDR
jgi:hypothetical protein